MTESTNTNGVQRGGAPLANRNRMTWGGRGWAAIGSYPKGFSVVRRYVGRMRAELETAVCAQHGEIGVLHAALVQSACRHEGRALLLQRLLRVEPDLTVADKIGIMREIGNATDSRDKCLKSLGLDATKQRDPWSVIDTPAQYAQAAQPALVGGDGAAIAASVVAGPDAALDPVTANGATTPAWQPSADGMHETSTSGKADPGNHSP